MQIDAAGQAFRLAIVFPTLVATVVMVLYFLAQPHWLADPDAQDYAQLGRQWAAGRGSITRYMPWNGLDYLTSRGQRVGGDGIAPSWPNIVRFPLTPVLMAVGFTVFGPNDDAVHVPASLAFVLTAGGAALLAARLYGPWAGFVAGLTVACLPLLVNYSLTGLTEPLLGLLILGVLVCVIRRPVADPAEPTYASMNPNVPSTTTLAAHVGLRERAARAVAWTSPDSRLLMLGGALLGLAILNRYDTALLAAVIIGLWLLPRQDRWRATARFLMPALVIVLPWALYLTVVAGTPLFNLQPASIAAQASGRADGLGWYLPQYVVPTEAWTRDPTRAFRTAVDEFAGTPNHLRKLIGWPWLLAGAAACAVALVRAAIAVARLKRERAPWQTWLSGSAAVAVFLLLAVLLRALLASVLGLNLQRHFVPIVPLLVVVVAGEADWLVRTATGRLGRSPGPGRMLLLAGRGALALLLVVPGLWTTMPFLAPPSRPPGPPTRSGEVEARPENLTRLAQIVGPSGVVASNVPWSVAWQADRHAVPLPPTVDDTAALEQRFGISLSAIYVAGQVTVADAPRSWRTWEDLRRRGVPPPGYVLAESFENGGRLFVKQR